MVFLWFQGFSLFFEPATGFNGYEEHTVSVVKQLFCLTCQSQKECFQHPLMDYFDQLRFIKALFYLKVK